MMIRLFILITALTIIESAYQPLDFGQLHRDGKLLHFTQNNKFVRENYQFFVILPF